MYFELLPHAKACGVKIATENMFNWDPENDCCIPAACSIPKSFLEHLKVVNDDYLIACLDIGHSEMSGAKTCAVDMIRALGDKLQSLHIHDNDKRHDCHQIPFSMKIDFEPICKALKEINYCGYFTLEANNYLQKHNENNLIQGIDDLASSAKKLVELFNK